MSWRFGVTRRVIGSGEEATGNHFSTSMPRLLDKPERGVLANSSSKPASAGRTMLPGRVSYSSCLCKANGSVVCGRVMAETMATLAFLSALAMFLSPLVEKGKWLATITAALAFLAFVQSPFEGIHQSGGSALIIVTSMCGMIQYHIHNGMNKKYLNGFGGAVTFVLLLAMYPESGIRETVNEYTTTEGVIAIFESILAGIVLAQLMYNSINFDNKNSIGILLILVSLGLLSNLVSYSELFVVTISLCFVGFLPYLEERITPKIGSGKGRANALAISTLIGIILIFAITYASLSSVNRIGDGSGAIAVALWLTVAVTAIGLIGMLLPLFGFDEHPRPEAWGWRFGLSVSAILISLQTDLSGHLLLGIALAILISVSSPLVLEKGQQKAAQ